MASQKIKLIVDKPIPSYIQRQLKKPMKPIELIRMLEVIELENKENLKNNKSQL